MNTAATTLANSSFCERLSIVSLMCSLPFPALLIRRCVQETALKPEIQARAMERLKGVINHSLRSSDAFSRYSVSQYIILLPSVTYENGEQVMRRIMSAFNKAYVRKDVAVTYSLNLILPKEDTIEA